MAPLYVNQPLSMPTFQVVAFNKSQGVEWNARLLRAFDAARFQPSDEQASVLDEFASTLRNIIIKALAGTGKSTLLEACMYTRADGYRRIASTTHSMGKRALEASLTRRPKVEKFKTYKLIDATYAAAWSQQARSVLTKLVSHCKANLLATPTPDTLDMLALHHGINMPAGKGEPTPEAIYELVPQLLAACRADTTMIDFDDMIWLPVALDLDLTALMVDVMGVDESQDLNPVQIELIMRMAKRWVFVGDENQAIYGFRGADVHAMDTIRERLEATPAGVTVLPLTLTRRCPQTVVTLSQQLVSTFTALPDAPQGSIKQEPAYGDYSTTLPPVGDMVLCRVNVPLIRLAYQLVKANTPVRIQGRDFGAGLAKLIKQLAQPSKRAMEAGANVITDVSELLVAIEVYEQTEATKLLAQRHPDERLAQLQEQCQCLNALCDGMLTVADVLSRIETLFADIEAADNHSSFVLLSSVHRAKGMESHTVRIIEPQLMPHPMARVDWEQLQERNITYVAITRAQHTLIFHGEPGMLNLPDVEAPTTCPTCDGLGLTDGGNTAISAEDYLPCHRCGGTGIIHPF